MRKILPLTIAISLIAAQSVSAEPWRPGNEDEIIESLPIGAPSGLALTTSDSTLEQAIASARASLLLGQRYSDPRQYGYAEAMLASWNQREPGDSRLAVLNARIQQFRHDFDGAKARLHALLKINPDQAEAWLLLATIEQVQGNFAPARAACARVAGQGDLLTAITCGAGVASLTGSAQPSADLLQRQLEGSPNSADAIRLWAWTLLGEMRARLGEDDAAATAFQEALRIDAEDVYARSAYADLELQRDKPQAALDLIGDRINADALLLRAAIAARRAKAQNAAELHAAFTERVDEMFRRGDFTHRRELARGALELNDDADGALKLALDNWKVQREPADALLVMQTALASDHKDAAAEVIAFVQANKLEDVHMAALIKELQ
ncbi:MAG: tetratricopeptide repeat protein [Dokdonella sp.]